MAAAHINTRKIIDAYLEAGTYTIPVHEFLRALLYGDGEHYDPESSPIPNLLQISQQDGREHFLLPLLLSEVQVQGERFAQEGFVSSDHTFGYAQSLGFNEEQISAALDRAVHARMLESSPRFISDAPHAHYRITTVGAYTCRVLVHMFAYLDAIVSDTSIIDPNYREKIEDVRTIGDRVSRADLFRVYLDNQWRNFELLDSPFNWTNASGDLRHEIERIRLRLIRNLSPGE